MHREKIGENLSLEWDREPFAQELWSILKYSSNQDSEVIGQLEDLSKRGSTLAKTFLGEAYLFGQFGTERDAKAAESWLKLASDRKSIEAGYWLSLLYERQGKVDQAIVLHRNLSQQGYSPSLFSLGIYYTKGVHIEKDASKGLEFFQAASRLGHAYSAQWVSYLMRTGRLGLRYVPIGVAKWFPATFNLVRLLLTIPQSDRLRR